MKFKVGDKVKHKNFGVGEIVYIDEGVTAMPYTVQFKIFDEMWCKECDLELDELDALRKENEELKVKLKDYSLIIDNLSEDVMTYRSMYEDLKKQLENQ
jgi:hypothetical protein